MTVKKFLNYGGKTRNRALMESRVQTISQNHRVAQLAGRYWDLIVGSDYLKDVTYLHWVEGYTHQEIHEQTGVNLHTIKITIHRDGQRVLNDLTLDLYQYIEGREYSNSQVNHLMTIVERLGETVTFKDRQESLLDKLNVKLDGYQYVRDIELDDINFIRVSDLLAPLSKPYSENLLREVDDAQILGYIKYLLGSKDEYLNKRDLQRKESLKQSWWLNEG